MHRRDIDSILRRSRYFHHAAHWTREIALDTIMSKLSIPLYILTATCLVGWSAALADSRHGHAAGGGKTEVVGMPSCQIPVHITENAEGQPGGALYKGPSVMHHMKRGNPMPEMKGMHVDHRPRHGGAFFMAPDKMHHLEGMFSERCGFRLVFYNAMTKPIRADRFRAFIKAVPEKEHEPEVIRFLSVNAEGTVFRADIGDEVTRPFEIELYVKFPETDEPQLFNIRVPALAN
jgi:hypothetical protein